MKETRKQLTEFCPKCQKTRNINGVTSTRNVEGADGTKHIVTISYHCEACNTFVRSEEHEVEEKNLFLNRQLQFLTKFFFNCTIWGYINRVVVPNNILSNVADAKSRPAD